MRRVSARQERGCPRGKPWFSSLGIFCLLCDLTKKEPSGGSVKKQRRSARHYFLCAHAARRPISANSSRNRRKSAAKESGNQRFPLFCISPSFRLGHSPIPVSLLRPETKGAKASSYARFTVAWRRELSNV